MRGMWIRVRWCFCFRFRWGCLRRFGKFCLRWGLSTRMCRWGWCCRWTGWGRCCIFWSSRFWGGWRAIGGLFRWCQCIDKISFTPLWFYPANIANAWRISGIPKLTQQSKCKVCKPACNSITPLQPPSSLKYGQRSIISFIPQYCHTY